LADEREPDYSLGVSCRALVIALLCAATALACGDDANAIVDAAIDADTADTGPDAFDPCPGQTTLETELVDFVSKQRIEQTIMVSELDTTNTVMAAPNGRAILCLDGSADTAAVYETDNYLPRTQAVKHSIARSQFASTQPYQLRLFTESAADDLAVDLGEVRDAADTFLIVDVHALPDGTALAGASVTLGASYDGAYADKGDGSYPEGTTTLSTGRIVFVNVDATSGDTSVSVTADGATCEGPASTPLSAGEISGVLQGCQ